VRDQLTLAPRHELLGRSAHVRVVTANGRVEDGLDLDGQRTGHPGVVLLHGEGGRGVRFGGCDDEGIHDGRTSSSEQTSSIVAIPWILLH